LDGKSKAQAFDAPFLTEAYMETSRSQRWRDRRALWAADFRTINPRAYSVDIIEHAVARGFIAEHHYLPSYPAAQVAIGLFGRRAALEGVAVFAVPATSAVITRHTGFTDPAKGRSLAPHSSRPSSPKRRASSARERFGCSARLDLQSKPSFPTAIPSSVISAASTLPCPSPPG
jgi:hypothetical protein